MSRTARFGLIRMSRSGPWGAFRKVLAGLLGLVAFVLALQLLNQSASGLGTFMAETLSVDSIPSALGFGWLFAYVVLSGSPVAAVSLSFFASGVLDSLQTFAMIAGSRFGASLIVLLIAFVYALRKKERGQSLEMGILSLLTTYAIYLIAVPLGLLALMSGAFEDVEVSLPGGVFDLIEIVYGPIVRTLDAVLPAWALFLVGVGTIILSFNVFDRALPDLSKESPIRNLEAHVYRPIVMFGLGSVITLFTLSVSVSLGILVPLSAKGIARRENVIPYILGANITTFVDTLFASFFLGEPDGFGVVLVAMVVVALVSVTVLVFQYARFERILLGLSHRIVRNRITLSLFLATILLTPLALLLV